MRFGLKAGRVRVDAWDGGACAPLEAIAVPAQRSRTTNWRQCLSQVLERNGTLEISLPDPRHEDGEEHERANLIWRVRLLALREDEIIVEQPVAMGELVRFEAGIELAGVMAIGQNRWMFRTELVGLAKARLNDAKVIPALRLRMPERVERCQRRNFYRVSTVALSLPHVDCFALLDPASAALAEAANRVQILELEDEALTGPAPELGSEDALPRVGPSAHAVLANIGGGGVGLLLEEDEARILDSHRLFWLRVGLTPHIPAPLGVTARLRHTHIDSSHRVYAGMAFEFGHNPPHQRFVVDQLCRYVAQVQREQLGRPGTS